MAYLLAVLLVILQNPMISSHDIMLIGFDNQDLELEKCNVEQMRCRFRKSKYSTDNSSIVVFHAASLTPFPPKKMHNQIWVYYLPTPDVHVKETDLLPWKNLFNWTMGHRSDSDIVEKLQMTDIRHYDFNTYDLVYFEIKNDTYASVSLVDRCFTVNCLTSLRDGMVKKHAKTYFLFPLQNWKQFQGLNSENLKCQDKLTIKNYKQIFHGFCNVEWRNAFLSNHYYISAFSGVFPKNLTLPEGIYANVKDPDVSFINEQIAANILNGEPWWRKWLSFYQFGHQSQLCSLCDRLFLPKKPQIYDDIASWVLS